jgi:hypothetical protein
MAKIDCTVTNCSHNKDEICYANRINVSGGNAEKVLDTCCASFLNSDIYSNLTNNTNDKNHRCSAIVCTVPSCEYNKNQLCYADNIQVNGEGANIYEETNCSTFRR